MFTNDIDFNSKNHENISEKIESVTFNSIRKILPDKAIKDACDEAGYRYRERIITPIVTVLHMILAAIWPEESFAASWQILWTSFSSVYSDFAGESPSLGSVAKARYRLPLEMWKKLFEWLSIQAQNLSQSFDKWKEHRVVLLDGSCVSMPYNYELFRDFGRPTGYHGKCRYPLARLVTLCLANTMTVLDYSLGRYDNDENFLARPLLEKLRKGDLLLADRHFAAAHFYWHYQSIGLEFLTKAHQNLKISRIKRIESYGQNDFVGWLNINKIYRRKNPDLPEKIMVRFIRIICRERGQRKSIWFATSLLDNKLYPAREIAQLYGRRWRIETLFREVKINLSADVLRSMCSCAIRKEVAARLIAVNIVRMIMLEAATEKGVDPIRLSFVHAVRSILSFAPALACEPVYKLPQIYRAMLLEIGTFLVPERPGRNEPRALTREWKHYPRLKCTREQWRTIYAA
jgi:hypothetical protein